MQKRLSLLMVIVLGLAAACQQERAEMVEDTPPQTQPPAQPDVRGTAANTATMNPVVPPQGDMPSLEAGGAASPNQGVHLIEYAIHMPQTLEAGPQSFRIENGGKEMHSFEIEGNGMHAALPSPLSRGGRANLDVNLPPGTYTVYCPVDGHRERGMEMKLTVKQ